MQKHSDEALVAYLDDELDSTERRHVEAWLEADPAVRDRLAALAQSTDLARSAYADIVNEPVPARLIAAARGETSQAGRRKPRSWSCGRAGPPRRRPYRRWHIGLAAAAGLFGIVFGGAGTYFGMGLFNRAKPRRRDRLAAVAANNIWLDNAAGYYKLTVNAGDNMLVDVPASNDTARRCRRSARACRSRCGLPDLKPWGLSFRGARLVVVDGRPAAQLVYVTDNKAIGPLTLVIGASKQPDIAPTFERRQDVNLLYWRHPGPRLCARRPGRYRLSLGHRQRRRLAARRDLASRRADTSGGPPRGRPNPSPLRPIFRKGNPSFAQRRANLYASANRSFSGGEADGRHAHLWTLCRDPLRPDDAGAAGRLSLADRDARPAARARTRSMCTTPSWPR